MVLLELTKLRESVQYIETYPWTLVFTKASITVALSFAQAIITPH